MDGGKLTKRKLQALETRGRIFETAKRLFREQGIDRTSIADIVGAAGVSTGTFYLYFKSKDQIVSEIYMGEDSYYDSLAGQLTAPTWTEKIVEYFDRSSRHIESNGLEIVKQLYFPTNPAISQQRRGLNAGAVERIVVQARNAGELRRDIDADEIVKYLFSLTSGIIFEWCIQDGSFDMNKRTVQFIRYALEVFRA